MEDSNDTIRDSDDDSDEDDDIHNLTTKKYVCPYCKQAFDGGGHGLSDHFAHMRTHKDLFGEEEEGGTFKCRICNKSLRNYRVLYEHIRLKVRISH
jgi:hypothetical protein